MPHPGHNIGGPLNSNAGLLCHTLCPILPCNALTLPHPALPCPALYDNTLPSLAYPSLLCLRYTALPFFIVIGLGPLCPTLICPAVPCPALLCAEVLCTALCCPALPLGVRPCCTMSPYTTVRCTALLCLALPHPALLHIALPSPALRGSVVHYPASPCSAWFCSALLCLALPSRALPCYTVPSLALHCTSLPFPASTCVVLPCWGCCSLRCTKIADAAQLSALRRHSALHRLCHTILRQRY